ncbi:hypothetical protein LA76x_1732 [Lysobacter antibioticus]|uniref:Uncharacterized protein n=1 Tax=Lysobacter antibioticus TaxID=84531 RepID=A0A0S2F8M8_LYSAN|nr:hypothetical protein LA76x_1732 [Lysobacter antibioticus]
MSHYGDLGMWNAWRSWAGAALRRCRALSGLVSPHPDGAWPLG